MTPELFMVKGAANSDLYHYRECGLENIFLVNGFQREIVDGEEYVSFQNIEGLWKAIGLHVISSQQALGPKEVRFLRGQMDMTQVELGGLLRVSAQTVARWEKGQAELPGPADFALRVAYLLSPVAQPEGYKIIARVMTELRRLSEQDEVFAPPPALHLHFSHCKWTGSPLAA